MRAFVVPFPYVAEVVLYRHRNPAVVGFMDGEQPVIVDEFDERSVPIAAIARMRRQDGQHDEVVYRDIGAKNSMGVIVQI